jgi:hypothetical protein
MNLQLLFQLLLYEAETEGLSVESAHEIVFEIQYKRLCVKTSGKQYLVTLKTAEEKMLLRRRRPILTGPEALEVTFHVNEMTERQRTNLVFHCSSLREVLPHAEKFTDEFVSVRFTSVKQLNHHKVHFDGVVYVTTSHLVVTQRVVGEYDSYTQTGWMQPDLFSPPETLTA